MVKESEKCGLEGRFNIRQSEKWRLVLLFAAFPPSLEVRMGKKWGVHPGSDLVKFAAAAAAGIHCELADN